MHNILVSIRQVIVSLVSNCQPAPAFSQWMHKLNPRYLLFRRFKLGWTLTVKYAVECLIKCFLIVIHKDIDDENAQ